MCYFVVSKKEINILILYTMKNLIKKLNLTNDTKEVLTVLLILVIVYVILLSILVLISGTFNLGFAYVGLFVVSAFMSIAASGVNHTNN